LPEHRLHTEQQTIASKMTILSAAILLFLVMDPMGNVPLFVTFLGGRDMRRARRIVVRELLIALAILVLFLFGGQVFLRVLHVSEPALSIAGGVILFLIAIKMIFGSARDIFRDSPDGEPFVVPLAVPLIAGPSAAATVLLLMAQDPTRWLHWVIALCCAWCATGTILLFAPSLSRLLGARGLSAVERLMGMLLTTVAVQMFLSGLRDFLVATG
jgi:multiple antibiotic resistance protein